MKNYGVYCCKTMEESIESDDIKKEGYHYYIFRKPQFEPDGDNLYDNMTGNIEIEYCPFCGKSILKTQISL